MRYAVISDIHANLEALQAVFSQISILAVDAMLCLGDIVGYNADPNECLEVARNEGIRSIMGNHDSCACGLEEADDFNPAAQKAILWTRGRLTEVNRGYLTTLPRELSVDNIFLFHGSVHDTNRYIRDTDDVRRNFSMLQELTDKPLIGFFGHTHVQGAFSFYRGAISPELSDELLIADSRRYLINPGSVGQPRDGDPRAAFLVYDNEESTVSFYRIEYDIGKCQEKIMKAGLPRQLAERLFRGM